MIPITKLRSGTTFLDNDEPYQVIKYTHVHLSRGSGTIKVKARHLKTGSVYDKTFKSGDRVEEVDIRRRQLQFLYQDQNEFFFMDPTDFSQITLPDTVVKAATPYFQAGDIYTIIVWENPKTDKEEPLGIDLPLKLNCKVKTAAPGVKGDTAASVYKEAWLENGLKVRVPLFINSGDTIRIDTRNGQYVERVS